VREADSVADGKTTDVHDHRVTGRQVLIGKPTDFLAGTPTTQEPLAVARIGIGERSVHGEQPVGSDSSQDPS
jgi:hypothetical protein